MSPFIDATLHCFKYSGLDVCGLFLSKSMEPEMCIPLFHSSCSSGPLFQVAMSLIDGLNDWKIVGFYFASANRSGFPVNLQMLATKIAEVTGNNIVFWKFTENKSPTSDRWPFCPITLDGEEKEGGSPHILSSDIQRLRESISNNSYVVEVTDFEDFLSDPSSEWIKV
jgi:hypothetical protein